MIFVHKPEGGAEQRWDFDLARWRVAERQIAEKRAGVPWGQFKQAIGNEDTGALQVLLWMMLRRTDPSVRLDDVDFCDEEIDLQPNRAELERARADIAADKNLSADDRAAQLAEIDALLPDAPDGDGEGKAPPNNGSATTP